ncbi:hypothetical protein AVEN_93367-1 [Araneus ventricosus]|uniref:Uncharacterized protein n=1 Tax=Araneus ventricosus TaxID=182803 RepID=A0A4Y2ANU2_ARAVE|nr:hypothetical protein AVEN_93367-1 [Araneus ventricosus]
MNYFSVIRLPAGQITRPQSCASLHGVDWKRSTLDRGSLSATRVWPTQAGRFYYSYVSSCVAPGASLCGPNCRGKEIEKHYLFYSKPCGIVESFGIFSQLDVMSGKTFCASRLWTLPDAFCLVT